MNQTLFIETYLPQYDQYVRFRSQKKSQGKSTRLIKVADLISECQKYPDCKISVSPACFAGKKQKDAYVRYVASICIDLDSAIFATDIQLEQIRKRFPGAGIVRSNGLTLYYKIPVGKDWGDMVLFAYQIGCEAAEITGLKFDYRTLLRDNGQPGAHRNHLFRFPAGWADRGGAVPEFIPSDIKNGQIEVDAHGLNHALPCGKTTNSGTPKKRGTLGPKKAAGGSQEEEYESCSTALRIRRHVISNGGTISEAINQAASATGKSPVEIKKLFSHGDYKMWPLKGPSDRLYFDLSIEEIGVVGGESSSRKFQWTFTVSANFGHSVQALWDVNMCIEAAYSYVLHSKSFDIFKVHFSAQFGDKWRAAIYEDMKNLHTKYAHKKGLDLFSKKSEKAVFEALKSGLNKVSEIAEKVKLSERQVRRIIYSFKDKGWVQSTGKTKNKKWSINSGHTDELKGKKVCSVTVALKPLDLKATIVGGVNAGNWIKKWIKPRGCPANTKGGLKAVIGWKSRLNKTLKMTQKDEETKIEINALGLPSAVCAWWCDRPADYRKLKSRCAYVWKKYRDGNFAGDRPLPLTTWLVREFESNGNGVLSWIKSKEDERRIERMVENKIMSGRA